MCIRDSIAADPPAAAHLLGQFLRAHAHAQHLPDLEARCRLSLWRTRRNDWQSRSSSSTRGCVRILALRGRAARAVCARTRQPMLTLAVRALLPDHSSPLSIACQDGAQPSAVNNLFLRSRLCSLQLEGVAQPSAHSRARCMHFVHLQSRAPRRSGAGNTRLVTAGRP